MIDSNATVEEVGAYFANDHFATDACGCRIIEAGPGHAKAMFEITDIHRNAHGTVMGGAIFTLADVALAAACNIGEELTVSASNTIRFINVAKGKFLYATCDVDKSGRSLGFYTVRVEDELGTLVAIMDATCFGRDRH